MRRGIKPFILFHQSFLRITRGIERDERKYIAIIGNHLKNLDQTFMEAREVGPFSNLEQTFAIDETLPNPFHYMDQAILTAAKEKHIGLLLSGYGGDFFVSDQGNEVIYELIKISNSVRR